MKEVYPETKHGIVNRRTGPFSYQAWPTVCKNIKGELFVVYSGLRLGHICPFGKTIMQKSIDEGETWSLPVLLNDTALDDRDAGILCIGNDRLLVTWFCHPAKVYLNDYYESIKLSCLEKERPIAISQLETYKDLNEEEARGGSFIRISNDNGYSFGNTVKVPVSSPHGPNILSDGSLAYLGKEMYSDIEEKGVIALYISTDEGHTWNRKSYVKIPEGLSPDNFHEPHIVQLNSGRLLGAIRFQTTRIQEGRNSFSVYTCYSDDFGKSWSIPAYAGVNGSPPHLLVHSSGTVIMTVGRREKPFGQRALLSYDNGYTWEDEYVLRNDASDGDLGYPSTAELKDNSLITVYYQKCNGDKKTSILYTKWSL